MHFTCDQFGCKLWLPSIQNYARHRFEVSKLLYTAIKVAVLFDWNLSMRPFLGQVVDLDLLRASPLCCHFGSVAESCRLGRSLLSRSCMFE